MRVRVRCVAAPAPARQPRATSRAPLASRLCPVSPCSVAHFACLITSYNTRHKELGLFLGSKGIATQPNWNRGGGGWQLAWSFTFNSSPHLKILRATGPPHAHYALRSPRLRTTLDAASWSRYISARDASTMLLCALGKYELLVGWRNCLGDTVGLPVADWASFLL